MNKAQYLSTAPEMGGNGRYPLSTQGLNFVQSQIELLQELSRIGGKRYILKQPTDGDGWVVIDNEIMPLYGAIPDKSGGIKVYQETQDIQADGETYVGARIIRYARYQTAYRKGEDGLYPVNGFAVIQTNAELNRRIDEIEGAMGEVSNRLEIRSGIFTAVQINNLFDNVRLQCRKGSVKLNGAETYSLNVYRTGSTAGNGVIESVTQEQILPDLRRFTRQYYPESKKWSKWTYCTDNFHIDVKVVDGNTVWVRHGEIPIGVQLVLLRKKKRNKWRRSSGSEEGKARRQAKNQYVHHKGIVLSSGEPNKWYVPKCLQVDDDIHNSLIGKELGAICKNFLKTTSIGGYDGYQIKGTRICIVDPVQLATLNRRGGSGSENCKTTAYVRIALQFAAAGQSYKGAGGEMVRMKYRIWNQKDGARYIKRHTFSME